MGDPVARSSETFCTWRKLAQKYLKPSCGGCAWVTGSGRPRALLAHPYGTLQPPWKGTGQEPPGEGALLLSYLGQTRSDSQAP